jgi:hypothetical protein
LSSTVADESPGKDKSRAIMLTKISRKKILTNRSIRANKFLPVAGGP